MTERRAAYRTGGKRPPVRRVDANQAEIVAALRKAGCTVQHLHTIGSGCPDLLVGYNAENWLLEIKAPGGTLTPDEREWWMKWNGQVAVARSAEDALQIIGIMKYGYEVEK